jgi:hypothetical protein
MTSSLPRHQLALVRPGETSLAWLEHAVHDLKADDPLQPITVVGPSPYLLSVMRRKLAERGCANVGFRVQLRPVAEQVARMLGSTAFDRPLTGPVETAAIRAAVVESAESTLRPLARNRALQESLAAIFRELRQLPETDPVLSTSLRGATLGAAVGRTYDAYLRLTRGYPDVPEQLRIATRLVHASRAEAAWIEELGALVLYLPQRVDAAELGFLEALGRHVSIAAALPWLDDPVADAPTRATADALAHALRATTVWANGTCSWPSMHVLSAPDPDEEARSVVRRLLADMETGVPLWRMAVFYAADDPYAALVRETLDAAGVPWHSALGRPAAAGVATRSLLGLLALRERGFTREAVLDWVSARPSVPEDATDPLPAVPISAWDRLSRRAQVLEGAEQWIGRFERLIATLEAEEQARQDWHAEAQGHEADEELPRPAHDLEHARAIVNAIRTLDRDTRPPTEPATWDASVEWASSLRHTYVRDDPGWPEAERKVAEALDAALESLRAASALEPTTSIGAFRDALALALEARRLEEGRAGVGVLLAPLGAASGASFERTYLVGMAEGFLPSRPTVDPLVAGSADSTDPLARRERQSADERRGFLSALSDVSKDGAITLSYARTDGAARASYPSRWLLEQVARIDGVSAVYASEFPKLFGAERPWLEHIASAYDGLLRAITAMSVSDLRLREVVAVHAAGRSTSETALAARADLVLGRALRAGRMRTSHQFTEFDGNLATVAHESERIAYPFNGESSASSATSLERWSSCPYQYFLAKGPMCRSDRAPGGRVDTQSARQRHACPRGARDILSRARQGRALDFRRAVHVG